MQIAKGNWTLAKVWSEKNSGLDYDIYFFFGPDCMYLLFHQKVNNKPTLITNYSNSNLEPRRSYLANQFSLLIATLYEGSTIFHDLCYGKNKLNLFSFMLEERYFFFANNNNFNANFSKMKIMFLVAIFPFFSFFF